MDRQNSTQIESRVTEKLLRSMEVQTRIQTERKETEAMIASDQADANTHSNMNDSKHVCSDSDTHAEKGETCYHDMDSARNGKTSVRYVGTQFGWRDATKELREQVRTLLDTDIMNMK